MEAGSRILGRRLFVCPSLNSILSTQQHWREKTSSTLTTFFVGAAGRFFPSHPLFPIIVGLRLFRAASFLIFLQRMTAICGSASCTLPSRPHFEGSFIHIPDIIDLCVEADFVSQQ